MTKVLENNQKQKGWNIFPHYFSIEVSTYLGEEGVVVGSRTVHIKSFRTEWGVGGEQEVGQVIHSQNPSLYQTASTKAAPAKSSRPLPSKFTSLGDQVFVDMSLLHTSDDFLPPARSHPLTFHPVLAMASYYEHICEKTHSFTSELLGTKSLGNPQQCVIIIS